MKKNEFLKFALHQRAYANLAWVIGLFTITRDTETSSTVNYPGKIIREPFGVFFINAAGEKEKIEDADPKNELFGLKDKIKINKEWVPYLTEPELDTTVGKLVLNYIVVLDVFKGKIPYINKRRFEPSDVEKEILLRRSPPTKPGEPEDPEKVYVRELLKFQKAANFVESLSMALTESVTESGMLPAPGIQAFRDKLFNEYGDRLKDPVVLAEYNERLKAYDDEYLKSNPTDGLFLSGKARKARAKYFSSLGGEVDGFNNSMLAVPVKNSLQEGIPLTPLEFSSQVSASRYSSFSRGAETINGGVAAKGLGRAADSWIIVSGDCGTTLGQYHKYTGKETQLLIGRYVIQGGKSILIESAEEASKYDGKIVRVRSPQFCSKTKGTKTCEICAGKALSQFRTGLIIPMSQMSGGILTDSLKKMHNTALVTETMDLRSTIM